MGLIVGRKKGRQISVALSQGGEGNTIGRGSRLSQNKDQPSLKEEKEEEIIAPSSLWDV